MTTDAEPVSFAGYQCKSTLFRGSDVISETLPRLDALLYACEQLAAADSMEGTVMEKTAAMEAAAAYVVEQVRLLRASK